MELKALFALFVVLAGALMLFLYDPATSGLFPTCPFYYLSGMYCPGCGTLRALHRVLNFRFGEAFAMNPLMVMALPFIGYGLLDAWLVAIFKKGLPTPRLHPAWLWSICAVIVLFGLARNLPYHPFDLLAPGALSSHNSF